MSGGRFCRMRTKSSWKRTTGENKNETHNCIAIFLINILLYTSRIASVRQVGVAGIHDFNTVKCLHCHLAHHLARPEHGNLVGLWTEQLLRGLSISFASPLVESCEDATGVAEEGGHDGGREGREEGIISRDDSTKEDESREPHHSTILVESIHSIDSS